MQAQKFAGLLAISALAVWLVYTDPPEEKPDFGDINQQQADILTSAVRMKGHHCPAVNLGFTEVDTAGPYILAHCGPQDDQTQIYPNVQFKVYTEGNSTGRIVPVR